MTKFGTIERYDATRRAGVIAPEAGGYPIVFAWPDPEGTEQRPEVNRRYRYDVLFPRDGGQPRAVNLQKQLSLREQAEAQRG